MPTFLHNILKFPFVYTLTQSVLAPGAEQKITKALRDLTERLPKPGRLLDVGCGPKSWLWKLGWQPTGLDLSFAYTRQFIKNRNSAVTGSCCQLPFADRSFHGVWTIGVLHHLDGAQARQAVTEMFRVCRPDGYVIIMDAVLPRSAWKRPIPYAIRKLDRGAWMRTDSQLEALLPITISKSIRRYAYSYTGLEMLEYVCCSQ